MFHHQSDPGLRLSSICVGFVCYFFISFNPFSFHFIQFKWTTKDWLPFLMTVSPLLSICLPFSPFRFIYFFLNCSYQWEAILFHPFLLGHLKDSLIWLHSFLNQFLPISIHHFNRYLPNNRIAQLPQGIFSSLPNLEYFLKWFILLLSSKKSWILREMNSPHSQMVSLTVSQTSKSFTSHSLSQSSFNSFFSLWVQQFRLSS